MFGCSLIRNRVLNIWSQHVSDLVYESPVHYFPDQYHNHAASTSIWIRFKVMFTYYTFRNTSWHNRTQHVSKTHWEGCLFRYLVRIGFSVISRERNCHGAEWPNTLPAYLEHSDGRYVKQREVWVAFTFLFFFLSLPLLYSVLFLLFSFILYSYHFL